MPEQDLEEYDDLKCGNTAWHRIRYDCYVSENYAVRKLDTGWHVMTPNRERLGPLRNLAEAIERAVEMMP